MKKLVSVFLVLALVMSLGMSVFAAQIPEGTSSLGVISSKVAMSADPNMSFQVVYQDRKGAQLSSPDFPNGDVLTFDVKQVGSTPAEVPITVGSGNSVTVSANPTDVKINIPTSYTVPGRYNYTIKQTGGTAQGVTYGDTTIKLQVLVTNNSENDGLEKQVSFTATASEGKKVNSVVNKFNVTDGNEGNKFTVKKVVAGNLADHNTKFKINVTLEKTGLIATDIVAGGSTHYNQEAWKGGDTLVIPLELKHNDEIAITGVPAGVKFTVAEDGDHIGDAEANMNDKAKGYTVTYKVNAAEKSDGKIPVTGDSAVEVTNTKNIGELAPETGVYLEAMPYIILLAVAVIGLVLFAVKRRANREY